MPACADSRCCPSVRPTDPPSRPPTADVGWTKPPPSRRPRVGLATGSIGRGGSEGDRRGEPHAPGVPKTGPRPPHKGLSNERLRAVVGGDAGSGIPLRARLTRLHRRLPARCRRTPERGQRGTDIRPHPKRGTCRPESRAARSLRVRDRTAGQGRPSGVAVRWGAAPPWTVRPVTRLAGYRPAPALWRPRSWPRSRVPGWGERPVLRHPKAGQPGGLCPQLWLSGSATSVTWWLLGKEPMAAAWPVMMSTP